HLTQSLFLMIPSIFLPIIRHICNEYVYVEICLPTIYRDRYNKIEKNYSILPSQASIPPSILITLNPCPSRNCEALPLRPPERQTSTYSFDLSSSCIRNSIKPNGILIAPGILPSFTSSTSVNCFMFIPPKIYYLQALNPPL